LVSIGLQANVLTANWDHNFYIKFATVKFLVVDFMTKPYIQTIKLIFK
jgi:hypothetical protein